MASTIDTSAIDTTKPTHGNPTTASVRANFGYIKTALNYAKSEIEALQSVVASFVTSADLTTLLSGKEDSANKSTSITTDQASDTKYSSVKSIYDWVTSTFATKSYAESLVVGLLDDRGSFDASGNVFPNSGGSGSAGAILKGDLWFISVAGTLGGVAVGIGTSIRALSDSPGQTAGLWDIISTTLGFTPENASNKSTSITTDQASDTKYPSVKSVYDWATGLFKSSLVSFNAQTGTSYTLVLSDLGLFVTMSNTSANTLTVPPNSGVAFPVGTQIDVQSINTGQTTLVAGSGVTINATPGLKLTDRWSACTLIKTATDTWTAVGRLSA